jgi:S-adenosylmethionine:tRNA ribosyltransferase-isomerase
LASPPDRAAGEPRLNDALVDFDYTLPPELIAQRPLAERSASRLLRFDLPGGAARDPGVHDLCMRDLPAQLRTGDLLIFNDTRVVAARLAGRKRTGGQVEILLERALDASRALVQMRASKGFIAGQVIDTAGGDVTVVARRDELWEVRLPAPPLDFFDRFGSVPLPPYITRAADDSDRERYQSVLARVPGAVAAPTASLHFDAALLAALEARGVQRATVTLHVGAGTFQPPRAQDLAAHRMHPERYEVTPGTVESVRCARTGGGRVIAVGTTVARALESSAINGELRAGEGDTRLFIRPGFQFHVIDGLLTNFHLPQSTLLMLVCALGGRERVLAAYRHAVTQGYRFFSYGDAMLFLPAIS